MRPGVFFAPVSCTTVLRIGYRPADSHGMPASEHFGGYLELRPNSANVFCNMANLRMTQQQPREAVVLLKKAVDVAPECVQAHPGCGQGRPRIS